MMISSYLMKVSCARARATSSWVGKAGMVGQTEELLDLPCWRFTSLRQHHCVCVCVLHVTSSRAVCTCDADVFHPTGTFELNRCGWVLPVGA
jgi:hypothetical protein